MTEFKLFVSYLALLAAMAGLASCNDSGQGAAPKANRNDIVVTVKWVDASEVDAACKSAGAKDGEHFNGCAASGPNSCTIHAVQPRNFGDEPALRTLGHEAWHCFGARH